MKSLRELTARLLFPSILLCGSFGRAELWPAWLADYQYPIGGFAVDPGGSVFIAGPLNVYTNGIMNSNGAVVAKIDTTGALEWTRFFRPQQGDSFSVRKLACSSEGGCYVGGNAVLAGKRVISLQKYSPEGNLLWSTNDTETNGWTRQLTGISVSDTGRIFLSGEEFAGPARWNFLVIAFDSAGQQLWRVSYDGPANSNDGAKAILAALSGGCVAAGNSMGINSRMDYLLLRFDESGNLVWAARHSNTPSAWETLTAATQDWAGSIYVTGTSDPTNSLAQCVTVKYDAAGNELWSAQYRRSDNSATYGVALAADMDQNVLVTGRSSSDIVTVKYNPSGQRLWDARYNSGSGQPEFPAAIATDAEGRAYVAATLFRKPEGYSAFVSDVPAMLGYSTDGQLFMERRHSPCWIASPRWTSGLIQRPSGEFYLAAGDWIIKYSSAPPPETRIMLTGLVREASVSSSPASPRTVTKFCHLRR